MSQKKQQSRTEKPYKKPYFNLYTPKASQMEKLILQEAFEVSADHTCVIPGTEIEGSIYFIDVSNALPLCYNKWETQMLLAHFFVDEGMRAFPVADGLIVVNHLTLEEFTSSLTENLLFFKEEFFKDLSPVIIRYFRPDGTVNDLTLDGWKICS